ncbi:hypothetical protein PHYPSEUDO_013719 [Phytophthora pseudosyringae]|uniref:PLD phosphodiesterase domain-containing protein n=1 Tax=Phytophthora pseudosyringae TaxID=221518 RepID=A0A8T1V5M2_9STRA|nr:hypothetical protein PHYPSEUDO_013719 [Phytophthora pseudosyringae]
MAKDSRPGKAAKPPPAKKPATFTTPAERRKIIGRLLPFIRDGSEIDFEDIGQHIKPRRSARCIKKVYRKFMRGELWNQWGSTCQPGHEPIHVNRRMADILALQPALSLRAIAKRLGIAWPTFQKIHKKVLALPGNEIVFSRGNAAFKDTYKKHISITQRELWAAWFVVTDFELLDAGVELYVLRKKQTIQHQKMVIVDNVMVSLGSANPSKKGLESSFEFVTYHFEARCVDQCRQEFDEQIALARRIDRAWLAAEYAKLTQTQRLAAAKGSEGLTEEEMQALGNKKHSAKELEEKQRKLIERKEKNTAQVSASYHAKVEAGVCTKCGTPLTEEDGGCHQCVPCLKKRQFLRMWRRDGGLRCSQCHKPNVKHDTRAMCESCLLANRQSRQRRKEAKPEEKCSQCFKNDRATSEDGYVYAMCARCQAKGTRSNHKKASAKAAETTASEMAVIVAFTEEGDLLKATTEMERVKARYRRKRKYPPGQCFRCGEACALKDDGEPYSGCRPCLDEIAKRNRDGRHLQQTARKEETDKKYAKAVEQEKVHPTHRRCKRCPDDCALKRNGLLANNCKLHLEMAVRETREWRQRRKQQQAELQRLEALTPPDPPMFFTF